MSAKDPQEPTGDRKVVTMSDATPPARYRPIQEVDAYWQALRVDHTVPRRSDINPRGIESALSHAFVLERIAPGQGRLRLAGSHLGDLMGMDVRGMPFSAMFTAPARRLVSQTLERVFSDPARAILSLSSPAVRGQAAIEARVVLLPLESDLGDISRVLGCFVAIDPIGTAPRRFDVVGRGLTSLSDPLTDASALPAIEPVQTEVRGLAESPTSFEAGPRPYLRVVKNNRSE